jgi:uroporphyrinogen decarboxylase
MRQAGRYMAEYRELRRTYRILDIIKTPELACRVTMQPVTAFPLDAAIIFADILPPLEGMGLQLEFQHGEGPVILNPVRELTDIEALSVPDVRDSLWFTLEAIGLARAELDPLGIPLIGFSGAPFTLACYAIEGGSSPNFNRAKALMMTYPAAWHGLMEKLSELVGRYLLAQAEAGAQALQFFDSWVGILSPSDYQEYVQPHSRHALAIAAEAGVPLIHFGTDTGSMLELVRDAGGDVIGVDWRIDLAVAWERLGLGVAVQGNLDPVSLLGPWAETERRARRILDGAGGRPGHIFNLGHGVLQQTPPDTVRRLVEFVHEYAGRPAL